MCTLYSIQFDIIYNLAYYFFPVDKCNTTANVYGGYIVDYNII